MSAPNEALVGDDIATTSPQPPSRRGAAVAGTVLAVLVLGLLVGALGWRATGGRWLTVATPSMGRAAPVGTLVLTRPVKVADLRVGDIVTYHPPTEPNQTYTHRIVELTADGGFRTRGDINGTTDPWTAHQSDVVGKVVARWWGIGWLIKAFPILVLGGIVVWLGTHALASVRWRAPLRVIGFAFVATIAAFVVKPFVRTVLVTTSSDSAGAHATIVSTGLLPIRVRATPGGTHTDLIAGQVGRVTADRLGKDGQYHLVNTLHLSLPWWIAVILVCASPLIYCLTVGLPGVPLRAEPTHAA